MDNVLQTVFEKIVTHLRKQGKKAQVMGRIGLPYCRYRTPEGLSCAVGCLIPDDKYSESFERKTVQDSKPIQKIIAEEYGENKQLLDLLTYMQSVHDQMPLNQWESGFYHTAVKFELSFTPI